MSAGPVLQVLLVEDNPLDARLIREYLREFGGGSIALQQAETLGEALEHPVSPPPDAVLVDMSLPDSQGLPNVTSVLRRFPTAAIAVLTGQNEASLAAAAVRAGAQDYIVKGQVTGPDLVAAVRRAVERKRAQELDRLRGREALQKEFIANVSHEFRTPIAAIKGAVETLQEGDLPSEQQADFLDMIARHCARLAKLVEDVLLVSTLEGQRPPEVESVTLKPIVDRCLSDLAVLADKRGVKLRMSVPPDLRVKADQPQLERVLENLCANAVEYNREGGEVDVQAHSTDGEAVVDVRDTGTGIPPAELPKLFERFHRTNRSRTLKAGGSGLGLMIVKRLVEAQHGRIWAESAEGRGSTFHFTLPLA